MGGGFGGLNVIRALRREPVEILLIDQRNYNLFQPLLYEVATAALSPGDISSPHRRIFRNQQNVSVVLDRVEQIDREARQVHVTEGWIEYDHLILACGSVQSYFGNDAWAERAPGLKSVEDALEIRRRFLLAFEQAELESDAEARASALTFVIVGGGPTGVELAGTMVEFAKRYIPADFRHVDTTTARIILIDGNERLLRPLPEASSEHARRYLEKLGVEIHLETRVTDIDENGVMAGDERIQADNVFWAAGVMASPLGKKLDADLDETGRVRVNERLQIPGDPSVYVIGDMAHVEQPDREQPVPGVAPAAIQMGRYVGKSIRSQLRATARGETIEPEPFRYVDKGILATIGRSKAVGVVKLFGQHTVRGLVAWLLWALVHIAAIFGRRDRFVVIASLMWTYLFFERGTRLITGSADIHLRRPPDWLMQEKHRVAEEGQPEPSSAEPTRSSREQ